MPEDALGALDPQSYSVVGEVVERDKNDEEVMIQRAHGENVPLQPGGFDHFDETSSPDTL